MARVMMKGAELLTTITWILLTPACAFRNPSIDHNNMTRHSFHFSSEISINFDVSGEGARPLLLLHGFGASMESWNDILPDLARMFRVYRLDLKGHGLSSKPRDGAYSISEQARIVAAFIREYKLSNVTLIGHSYGGSVALMTYVGFAESPETNPVAKMVPILRRISAGVSILRVTVAKTRHRLTCAESGSRAGASQVHSGPALL